METDINAEHSPDRLLLTCRIPLPHTGGNMLPDRVLNPRRLYVLFAQVDGMNGQPLLPSPGSDFARRTHSSQIGHTIPHEAYKST